MKSIIIILFAVFFGLRSIGQIQEIEPGKTQWITVGEIKWLGNTKANLSYVANKRDSTYMLYLQDEEKLKNSRDMLVTKNFSIQYSSVDNTTNKLYEILNAFFSDENRKNKKLEKIIKLGNESVHIQHFPKITGHAIMFSTKENHILFTQKELKKLFGK